MITPPSIDSIERTLVFSRKDMARRGRIGGFAKAAKYHPSELTSAARASFAAKFLVEVDAAEPGLPDTERQRRAELLRKAYFARLALQSAKVRRQRADARKRREAAALEVADGHAG